MGKCRIKIFTLLCIILFILSGCAVAEFYPKEGEWYCEELGLQLAFGGQGDCFYLVDNTKINCACGSDRGSRWLTVGCQDADSAYFDLGEELFGAEFVSLSQDNLVVYNYSTNKEYVFYRVE